MRDTAGIHLWRTPLTAIASLVLAALVGFVPLGIAAHADESRSGPPSDQVTDRDRQFWSFQKLAPPAVPRVTAAPGVRTPIDAFILAELESRGLTLSPDADRSMLLRRVCLDLVGVLPSPQTAAEFLADESPEAYER